MRKVRVSTIAYMTEDGLIEIPKDPHWVVEKEYEEGELEE